MTIRLHNYAEVRVYLEKEHPDWLRALTPLHINASADYWPQKVLALSSVNAAMQNYVSIYEHHSGRSDKAWPRLPVLLYLGASFALSSWPLQRGRGRPLKKVDFQVLVRSFLRNSRAIPPAD
jgi:hypothetical protein